MCPLPGFTDGAGNVGNIALMLCQHCSAAAKKCLCYQHHPSNQCKVQHCKDAMRKLIPSQPVPIKLWLFSHPALNTETHRATLHASGCQPGLYCTSSVYTHSAACCAVIGTVCPLSAAACALPSQIHSCCHIPKAERLGLFSLEKQWLQSDLIATFQYVKGLTERWREKISNSL